MQKLLSCQALLHSRACKTKELLSLMLGTVAILFKFELLSVVSYFSLMLRCFAAHNSILGEMLMGIITSQACLVWKANCRPLICLHQGHHDWMSSNPKYRIYGCKPWRECPGPIVAICLQMAYCEKESNAGLANPADRCIMLQGSSSGEEQEACQCNICSIRLLLIQLPWVLEADNLVPHLSGPWNRVVFKLAAACIDR